MKHALFAGLIFDENDRPVELSYIGSEPCYVIDDAGFKRHISSDYVDRQIWSFLSSQIAGNEKLLAEQAAKMMGQEDIFTHAMIENQLKNVDQQFEALQKTGLPADNTAYLGMTGFKVVIDHHGDLVRVEQPSAAPSPEDE